MTSKKAWAISVASGILLVVLVFVGLFGAGFRFFDVKTPSMATVAPVGTLVVVQPEKSYAVGDVISFQRGSMSYTHRIVGGQSVQGWVTKGDLNASVDPLLVTNTQVIGKVVYCAKYVGFLVDALPWLLLGSAIVWAITLLPRIRPSWRWQIRLLGWSLVASLVALFQRPWVNMVMIGYVSDPTSGVDMHLVNTGIFPVKVKGTVLSSGQDAVVNLNVIDPTGHYSVTPQLALNFWWFLTLVVICLAPTVISLFIKGADPAPAGEAAVPEPAAPKTRIRRIVLSEAFAPALVVLVSILAVSLVLQASTQSTYSSVIKNVTNSAGARTWFTCNGAEVGSGALFVWPLTTAGTQNDLTVNNNDGVSVTAYKGTAAAPSASSPCVRDTQGSLMFNGATCINTTTTFSSNETYSEEVWFRAAANSANGRLMGFANDPTPANQTHYDRHVYLDPTGRVVFGVWPNQQMVVSSPLGKNYADSNWHHVVATSAPGKITLYVDGAAVSTRTDTAGQDSYTGYWQVGCGLLNQWQDATGVQRAFSSYFTGNLRLAAVYTKTLSATEVREHYQAGTN